MLERKQYKFLDEFFVLALEIDLVENFSHATHGPQSFDERLRLVVAALDEIGREIELLFVVAGLAGDFDLRRAAFLVAPDDYELFAREQVDHVLGIHSIDRRALLGLK